MLALHLEVHSLVTPASPRPYRAPRHGGLDSDGEEEPDVMDHHTLVMIERLVREGRSDWEIDRIVRRAVRQDRRPRARRLPRLRRGEPRR